MPKPIFKPTFKPNWNKAKNVGPKYRPDCTIDHKVEILIILDQNVKQM